jgi:DNA invertase Pin-like site-specific DNA recombinase
MAPGARPEHLERTTPEGDLRLAISALRSAIFHAAIAEQVIDNPDQKGDISENRKGFEEILKDLEREAAILKLIV